MARPEVSVVIPTRDRWRSLKLALAGALQQEDVVLEVVVVDDDGEPGLLERIAERADRRVRVVRLPRARGPAGARNAGISAARAPWVAFLDDDDVWAPRKLRRQLDALAAAGARWAWCGACYLQADGELICVAPAPTPAEVRASLPSGNTIPAGASTVVAATDLLRDIGGFDEEIFHLPDWDLWLRLAEVDGGTAVDEPLVGYVQHDGMLSRRRGELVNRDLARVEAKLRARGVRTGDRGVNRALLEWVAEVQLAGGRRLSAAGTFVRSALRHASGTDVLFAVGALGGPRGLNVSRRGAWSLTGPPPGYPSERPAWVGSYPELRSVAR